MRKLIFLMLFLTGCISNKSNEDKAVNIDSLSKVNHINDSINNLKLKAYSDSISFLKAKKTVSSEDKTITVIQACNITNQLKFEHTEYNYRFKTAERDETFLNIRIKLSSKSKWNNGGGNFLPNLNVFRLDKTNSPEYIGTMEYQLYQQSDINAYVLEQIFDYKESEVFVCWLSLKTPLSRKYIISVNKGKNNQFSINTVIGIIAKK